MTFHFDSIHRLPCKTRRLLKLKMSFEKELNSMNLSKRTDESCDSDVIHTIEPSVVRKHQPPQESQSVSEVFILPPNKMSFRKDEYNPSLASPWEVSLCDTTSDESSEASTYSGIEFIERSQLHVQFIDEKLGVEPGHVVSEIRIRPRTPAEDVHLLFYSAEEIEMFRRDERRSKLGSGSFQSSLVRSMTTNNLSEIINIKDEEEGEENEEEATHTEVIRHEALKLEVSNFKCVGFVDRADGRQGSSVVTDTNYIQRLSDDEKESLFYSSSECSLFQQMLTESDLHESPILKKISNHAKIFGVSNGNCSKLHCRNKVLKNFFIPHKASRHLEK